MLKKNFRCDLGEGSTNVDVQNNRNSRKHKSKMKKAII